MVEKLYYGGYYNIRRNFGERRLISQGMINLPVYVDSLVELVERGKLTNNGYIYLRYCSVADGKLYARWTVV